MDHVIGCPGFKASGVAAGIKTADVLDLGLIYSEVPATVAGLFTQNRIKAAPVLVDMERVAGGAGQAVIVNSGNANCCTGDQGMADAKKMAQLAADALDISGNLVLVSSTGVIGRVLPLEKIEAALPRLVSQLSEEGVMDVATAMMTTDTRPKGLCLKAEIKGRPVTLTGIIKGAGMIRPDMATMLCYILTDAAATAPFLKSALKTAAERSFNRASVDGDTSTNDTVLVLANGVSGVSIDTPEDEQVFQALLNELCLKLTRAMIKDGEGVNKLVALEIKGALTDADAFKVADTVGHSPLVKTAIFGEDANWGRIIAAVGRAGVPVEPERIDMFFDTVQLLKHSRWCGAEAEAAATEVMRNDEFSITVDLNLGAGEAALITCDFSVDYVKINADYRS